MSLRKEQRRIAREEQEELAQIEADVTPIGDDALAVNQPQYEYKTLVVNKRMLILTLNNWGKYGWESVVIANESTPGGHGIGTVFLILKRKHEVAHSGRGNAPNPLRE